MKLSELPEDIYIYLRDAAYGRRKDYSEISHSLADNYCFYLSRYQVKHYIDVLTKEAEDNVRFAEKHKSI